MVWPACVLQVKVLLYFSNDRPPPPCARCVCRAAALQVKVLLYCGGGFARCPTGVWEYCGGETRLISVPRTACFAELAAAIARTASLDCLPQEVGRAGGGGVRGRGHVHLSGAGGVRVSTVRLWQHDSARAAPHRTALHGMPAVDVGR